MGSYTPPVVITDGSTGAPGGTNTDKDKPVDNKPASTSDDQPVLTDADGKPLAQQDKPEGGGQSQDGDGGSDSGSNTASGSTGTSGTSGVAGVTQVEQPQPILDLHALVEVAPVPGTGPQTSLSVPVIPPPPTQGNLSTSELIQKVRTEARKTAMELIKATAEVI
jgi:hypothetical protein